MQPLSGTVQRYDWGTHDAIPGILGRPADDEPIAEYWLGAHASSPSMLEGRSLVDHIASGPRVLGQRSREAFGEQLPYLMKLLSARHPLSLQASSLFGSGLALLATATNISRLISSLLFGVLSKYQVKPLPLWHLRRRCSLH